MSLAGLQFSIYKTWNNGDTLTAPDLVASFNQFITNTTLATISGDSPDLATMRTTLDPTGGSLCTTLEQEIQRLRFMISKITGGTYWYSALTTNPSGISATPAANTIPVRSAGGTVDPIIGEASTSTTTLATTLTIDLGTVTTGDRIWVQGYIKWASSVSGLHGASIGKGAGTATVAFNDTDSAISNYIIAINASQEMWHPMSGVCKVTGGGTLTLQLSHAYVGTPSIVAKQFYVYFLKKQ